jgi:hypothetical protein
VFDLLFEANLSPFVLGQVFADFRHHCFELFVSLLAFLIIRLQRVVEGDVVRVFSLEFFEIFGDPSLG